MVWDGMFEDVWRPNYCTYIYPYDMYIYSIYIYTYIHTIPIVNRLRYEYILSRGFSFAKMGQAPLSDAEAWSSSSTCWSISTRRDDSGCSRPSQTICTSADGEWGNRGFLGYGNPKPWVPLISLILPTLGWFWDNPHDFGKLQILRISCCVFFS